MSDRASNDVYTDRGGPAILGFFHEAVVATRWMIAEYLVVPDEQDRIQAALVHMTDQSRCR